MGSAAPKYQPEASKVDGVDLKQFPLQATNPWYSLFEIIDVAHYLVNLFQSLFLVSSGGSTGEEPQRGPRMEEMEGDITTTI